MIRRTTKIVLEVLGIGVAGVAVLVALAAWRLSTGPVSLEFLAPYIEDDLAALDDSYYLKLGEVSATWGGWKRPLILQADGVSMLRRDGTLVTSIPKMEIGLGARQLLFGELAPTTLSLIDPKLRLRRDADGNISLGLGEEAETGEASDSATGDVLADFIESLAAEPSRDQPLTNVRIINGDINVIDDRYHMVWDVPDATIVLQRDEIGLRLDVAFNLSFGGDITQVHASGVYNRKQDTLVLGTGFTNLVPRHIAARFDGLEFLNWFDLALDGDISFAADLTSEAVEISYNLSSGPGRFDNREMYPDGLAMAAIQANGSIGQKLENLRIENLLIDLDGPAIIVTGGIDQLLSKPAIDFDIAMSNVPIDSFDSLWPIGVGQGARDWITENMSSGIVSELESTVKVNATDDTLQDLDVVKLEGAMRFSGTTVEYLRPMPPVLDVSGTTKFDVDRFDIFIEDGHVGNLRITDGKVGFTKFDDPPEAATIDLTIVGPATEALQLIDNPPLHYAERLDIEPAKVSGDASIALQFAFPLLKALKVGDLNPKAEAKIAGLKWHHVFESVDVDDGNLTVDVDEKRMIADGTVSAMEQEIDIVWRENFENAETVSEVKVSGMVDDSMLQMVASELEPLISGSAKVDMTYTAMRDGTATVEAVCDVANSKMAFPVLAWTKIEGEPGHAEFTLHLKDGKPVELAPFSFTSGDLTASGSATFTAAADQIDKVRIDALSTGLTRIAGAIEFDDGELRRFKVTGKSLDITHLMEEWFNEPDDGTGQEEESETNLDIDADVGRLYLNRAEERYVDDFKLGFQRRGSFLENVQVQMVLPTAEKLFAMSIEPTGDIRYVSASTEDTGDLVRVLGIVDTMRGGKLSLTGQFNDASAQETLSAKLQITDFRAVDAPVLARILTLASFTGIVDALSGNGISFNVLEAEIDAVGDVYTIKNGRAHGSALGLTIGGTYNNDKDSLDMEGTIVPAYFFNSILGNIPLIGKILVGEEGSGVFAASFRVTGPREDPDVSVNPVSALLPGVLRNILSGPGDVTGEQEAVYPYDDESEIRNK